jgi:phosphatidylglycerophosphate synthase
VELEKLTRRPIAARETRAAAAVATFLARAGLRPNAISVLSVVFAALAAGCLFAAGRTDGILRVLLWLGAAGGIQLRLLANLFDGMVAVEGGFRTKSGEIFNELPDRISDALILAAGGYAVIGNSWSHELGWAAASLAVITAYIRTLGAACGTAQYFIGPMAKQQRMFLVTAACVGNAAFAAMRSSMPDLLPWALALIVGGCVVTIARRAARIVHDLEAKQSEGSSHD